MSTAQNNPQQDDDEDYNDAQEPESGQEDRIPAGFHNARGVAGTAQMGFATTGTEQVSVEVELFELAEKPRATALFYFSDKAEADSVKKLRAMGWDGSDELKGIDANVVRVSVKYETYDGKRRMKVDVYAGGRFEMKNQMDAEQKKGFFCRLREIDGREAAPKAPGSAPAGKGYPPDWDKKGPPPKGPPANTGKPRVDL